MKNDGVWEMWLTDVNASSRWSEGGERATRSAVRLLVRDPSLRASLLFRICAVGGRRAGLARLMLLSFHSCDVSVGARIGQSLTLPHPFGIVVGRGAVIGDNVTLYHSVTLGSDRRGEYPALEKGVIVFPNAVIVGGSKIGSSSIIGANRFVDRDIAPNTVLRAMGD